MPSSGVYNPTLPTVPTNQEIELQTDINGRLIVNTSSAAPVAAADALANPTAAQVLTFEHAFGGTTWDRIRNNNDVTIHASAAETATVNGTDQVNYNARGINLVLDITAASGTTPTLAVKLQAKDAASGKYVDIPNAAFASQTGVATVMLQVYPGIATGANTAASVALPRQWRAVYTIGGTTPSFTFSLGGGYIL